MENEEREIRNLWTRASENLCNSDWASYAECWSHSPKIQLNHSNQGEGLEGWKKSNANAL